MIPNVCAKSRDLHHARKQAARAPDDGRDQRNILYAQRVRPGHNRVVELDRPRTPVASRLRGTARVGQSTQSLSPSVPPGSPIPSWRALGGQQERRPCSFIASEFRQERTAASSRTTNAGLLILVCERNGMAFVSKGTAWDSGRRSWAARRSAPLLTALMRTCPPTCGTSQDRRILLTGVAFVREVPACCQRS